MTHRNATSRTTPARPTAEESAAFSLAVLIEAESARATPSRAVDPASSGVVVLETFRGIRARPTHELVDLEALAAQERARLDARRAARRGWLAGGALAAALVGLFTLGMPTVTPTVAIEHSVRPAATLSLDHAEPHVRTAEAVLHADHRARVLPVLPRVDAPTEETVAEAEEPAPTPRATPARTATRSSPARSTPASTPTPKPSSTPAITADCVIDPSRCMPEQLTAAQIRSALQRVEGNAKRCAAAHGATADTRVRVQLSIEGSTGRVRTATAQDPHANALGRCVANELSNARFPSFTRSSMGVIYAVTL